MLTQINIIIQDMVYGFDSRSLFSFSNFDCGKRVVIFGIDNSSSVHIDNKKKVILIFG